MDQKSRPWTRFLLLITPLICADFATAEGVINKHQFVVHPSNRRSVTEDPDTYTYYISCYGVDGRRRFALDCQFELWLKGALASSTPLSENQATGGHVHDPSSRPLIYRSRRFDGDEPVYGEEQNLRFSDDQTPQEPYRVSGQTAPYEKPREKATVEWVIPEVSGGVVVNTQIVPPFRWYCVYDCYTPKLHWYRDFITIGIEGLTRIPDAGPEVYYKKVRDVVNHPDSLSYYIDFGLLPDLIRLADEYSRSFDYSRMLSLNDASLPFGGLFDIYGRYGPPHRSHRTGSDVDINQEGIPCRDDRKLIRAARREFETLTNENGKGGNTNSAIWCESGGRKHLDLRR